VDPVSNSVTKQRVTRDVADNVVRVDNEFDADGVKRRATLRRSSADAGAVVTDVAVAGSTSSLRVSVDALTSKVLKVDDLRFVYTAKSTMLQLVPVL
jgi:hypothetical protein